MSDTRFGPPSLNGVQITLTHGHPEPNPHVVDVRVNGELTLRRGFRLSEDAERFLYEENRRRQVR
jgi:hypothetical protein